MLISGVCVDVKFFLYAFLCCFLFYLGNGKYSYDELQHKFKTSIILDDFTTELTIQIFKHPSAQDTHVVEIRRKLTARRDGMASDRMGWRMCCLCAYV